MFKAKTSRLLDKLAVESEPGLTNAQLMLVNNDLKPGELNASSLYLQLRNAVDTISLLPNFLELYHSYPLLHPPLQCMGSIQILTSLFNLSS